MVCDDACRSPFAHTHTHTCTLCLSRVMLHQLKSKASGGNSLKSAASSASEAMIPLERQQQRYLQSAACFCVCAHQFYSILCSVFISILLAVVFYMHLQHMHISVYLPASKCVCVCEGPQAYCCLNTAIKCPAVGLISSLCIYIWKHLREHWQTQCKFI